MRSDSPRRIVDPEQLKAAEALEVARRFTARSGDTHTVEETVDALYQMYSPAAGFGDLPEPWWSNVRATVARLSDSERGIIHSAAAIILTAEEPRSTE